MDFFQSAIDEVTGTIWSFLVSMVAEAVLVAGVAAIQPALAVLVTGSFAIATILDLITALRGVEGARALKSFFLALIQVFLTLYLISILGL